MHSEPNPVCFIEDCNVQPLYEFESAHAFLGINSVMIRNLNHNIGACMRHKSDVETSIEHEIRASNPNMKEWRINVAMRMML